MLEKAEIIDPAILWNTLSNLLQGFQGTLAPVPDGAAIPRAWALLPWTWALSLTAANAS